MTSSNFVSVIKIAGQPILPPLINDCDRHILRRYKEEAVKVEATLEERSRKCYEELKVGYQDLGGVEGVNDSSMSSIDADQVMSFIRLALKDSSHLDEVKNLQQAIFEELRKYQSMSSQLKKCDSLDTLHNIDDFSIVAGSSREVSPTKSLPSEKFVSPPTSTEKQLLASDGDHTNDSVRLDVTNMDEFFTPNCTGVDLVEPRLSLSYPTTPTVENQSRQFDPNIPSTSKAASQFEDTPHKLIRRNSYTLESPSPSVLIYLKSLQLEDDYSTATLSSETSAKRNLNQLWSEVISSQSTATPMNHSAMSWKSDSELPIENDDLSFLGDNVSNLNVNDQILSKIENSTSKTSTKSSNPKKKSYCDNNNVPISVHKAATKIQAGIRGYLTRRLLRTTRVVELKNAIKDSLITALQMHTETTVSKAELELHKRLALQIESLCDEWHQIFFDLTPQEKMRMIEVDRNKVRHPRTKQPFLRKSRSRVTMESSNSSLTSSTKSVPARPKSLPLTKPLHSSSANYKPWK